MNRSKAPLALMEQAVMVLVFALAAALCLRVFVWSDRASRQSEARDRALTAAQSMAEVYKNCAGDVDKAIARMGGVTGAGGEWTLILDEEGDAVDDFGAYRAQVPAPESSQGGRLWTTEVSVWALRNGEAEGEPLCTLPIAYQGEVA